MTDSSPIPDTSTTLLRALGADADSPRWAEFVRLYVPVLRYFLFGLRKTHPSLDESLFDDIVQETLVALVTLFPEGRYDRSRGPFRDFLRGILRNKAMHQLEKRGRIASSEEDVPADTAPATPSDGELHEDLWRLLVDRTFREAHYSEQSKTVFLKLISGENSIEELSRAYRLKPNAIYQLKKRILDNMKKTCLRLSRDGGDLTDLLENLIREDFLRKISESNPE